MEKRYLFVAVALLAAGLVFTGCDLPDLWEGPTNEEAFIVRGTAEGKVVITEFTVKIDIKKPQKDDKYKIKYDGKEVSSGIINVNENGATQTITFIPTTGNQFEATLDIDKKNLTFTKGIPTSTGTIMGYRSEGSGTPLDPVIETDLDNISISLAVGKSAPLKVVASANGGGNLYYQWYRSAQNNTNGTAIVGATEASYTVSPTTAVTYYYYVKVGNANGGVKTSKIVEVKVIASNEIVVGDDDGMTPLYSLREAIRTLLGTNDNMVYTVNFAMDLPYPLLIDIEAFPGTGKLTIKSSVPFTKGIYITRSNVELNGLNMAINNYDYAAKYINEEPCAVLISERYYLASKHSPDALETYSGYTAYTTTAIQSVSIVNCNIVFSTSYNGEITGIYVDPYTAGRTTGSSDTRVRITGTTVDVFNTNGVKAQCFKGNNTDFSNNTFTSTGKVAHILFLLKLTYGDQSATNTVSFSNNKFTSSAVDNLVFEVFVNAARQIDDPDYKSACETDLVAIITTCATYGTPEHKFGELASIYRRLIEILFDQIPVPVGKQLLMVDGYKDAEEYTKDPSKPNPSVYYIMDSRDGIIMRP